MSASIRDPQDLSEVLGVPLSDEQIAAATSDLAPGLIVAGAGSGKTTVMAARVVWLVGTGQVPPAGVLGLTFTNKAAAELLQRIRAALGRLSPTLQESADDAVVCTYHAYAGQILREFGLLIGVEPTSELMSPVRQRQLAQLVARRADIDPAGRHNSVPELAAAITSLDSLLSDADVEARALVAFDEDIIAALRSRDQQRTGDRMLATASARRDLARLVEQYRLAKRDREVLDFADIVRLGARLARAHPQVGSLLRQRHRTVLLDEYQDTSLAQRVMLQALFGAGHPVTAVGDPCQAIYGWRGASPHNIDAFAEHFPTRRGTRAQVHTLATNRRSGSGILSLANDVAAGLRQIHSDVVPLRPDPGTGRGTVECALLPTIGEELQWLVQRLHSCGRPWQDIAVLARTNDSVGEVVAALRAARIPVQVLGKQALLALPEVRWILWALRLAADATANDALAGLLLGPPWRIGARDMALLARRADDLAGPGRADQPGASPAADLLAALGTDPGDGPCLADALHDLGDAGRYRYSPAGRQRMTRASQLIIGWQRRSSMAVADLVRAIAEESGLNVELRLGDATGAPGRPADDSGLVALIDVAKRFDDLDAGTTLGDFLAWTSLAEQLGDGPQAPQSRTADAVTVLTVHAAKGLEFPVVAIPGLVEGLFPSDQGRGTWATKVLAIPSDLLDEPVAEAIAGFPADPAFPRASEFTAFAAAQRAADQVEEIRLAYVAFTRAKQRLILSGHRWGRTQLRPRSPSPFLLAAARAAESGGAVIDVWTLPPDDGATNPLLAIPTEDAGGWIPPDRGQEWARVAAAMAEPGTDCPDDEVVLGWDRDLETLRAEAAAHRAPPRVGRTPDVSVSQWLARVRDPEQFALAVVRPVPRMASAQAIQGEEFHAWVAEQRGQLAIWEVDDLIDVDDLGSRQQSWREAFRSSPFAGLTPVAVEHPVAVEIGGQVVRGRIDAVFVIDDKNWVVDWKTGAAGQADPLQLALYAAAWAAENGLSNADLVGCFAFVPQRKSAIYRDLPDVAGLQALAAGATVTLEPTEVAGWEV